MTKSQLHLRVVIPQHLRVDDCPAYESALQSLLGDGARVFLQVKLLSLSATLPAIIEGEASRDCIDRFLDGFPHIDQVVVLTQSPAVAARAAA